MINYQVPGPLNQGKIILRDLYAYQAPGPLN